MQRAPHGGTLGSETGATLDHRANVQLVIRISYAAATFCFVAGCSQSPAFVQPPPGEYAVARVELSTPSVDTVQGATVSRQFIRIIGIRPILGRVFIDNDFRPSGALTAVITYDLWTRRFGADATIIGKPIRLNGTDALVVGVTPKDFEFPKGATLWLPRR
ncbi:MAG: ABC transporter permease [Gemmatimonadaceae bacterium]